MEYIVLAALAAALTAGYAYLARRRKLANRSAKRARRVKRLAHQLAWDLFIKPPRKQLEDHSATRG